MPLASPLLSVFDMITDAALKIGDPGKTRVREQEWLLFYNQSIRELCQRANVLEYRATFDLNIISQNYAYPDELTQLTKVEANENPTTDPNGWQEVREIFEDEFRQITMTRYPTGSKPLHYFADVGWFWLVPMAQANIPGGARLTYFGLPDKVTDPVNGTLQLPRLCSDYVVSRMTIHAMMARNRLVEAKAELDRWYVSVEGLEDKLIDRSHDRRSTIAPRKNRLAGMR